MLLAHTKEGRVRWQQTPDNKVYVILKDLTLLLGPGRDNVFSPGDMLTVVVYNTQGKESDSFSADPNDGGYGVAMALYEAARRQVSGIDKALSNLENRLKESQRPFGELPAESDVILPPELTRDDEAPFGT